RVWPETSPDEETFSERSTRGSDITCHQTNLLFASTAATKISVSASSTARRRGNELIDTCELLTLNFPPVCSVASAVLLALAVSQRIATSRTLRSSAI